MISIKLRENSLEVKGHAQYAKPGEDIVCSAVSALTLTAAECMLREEAQGKIKVLCCDIENGYVSLKWQGQASFLAFLKVGFELLLNSYDKYIKEA